MEVTLRIHEADADERYAEVTRFLTVIARQHAEPAGIDRQRLMQRELGGEIGNRLSAQLVALTLAPGVLRGPRGVEPGDDAVVESDPLGIRGGRLQTLTRNELQQSYGVVRRLAPQRVVEPPEYLARVRVPAPPEVVRQLLEPFDAIRQLNQRETSQTRRQALRANVVEADLQVRLRKSVGLRDK